MKYILYYYHRMKYILYYYHTPPLDVGPNNDKILIFRCEKLQPVRVPYIITSVRIKL